jgi:hypothetical protein
MNRDVTKTGGGGVVAIPRISPQLRKILNHREVIASYGGDAGTDGGGEFRRGPWIKPDWVDGRERDEAKAALPAFEHMAGPAPEQAMLDFLNFIWLTTKHSSDLTWQGVCVAYPRVLRQFPAYCWRPEKLGLAPHAFPTWFPTAGELAAFLMPDKVWIEEEIAGLRGVAEANVNSNATAGARPSGKLRPWAEGGSEDNARWNREQADRERKELIEIMRKRDEEAGLKPADAVVPARLPGEGDKAYVGRLVAHTRDQIDLGARARRLDEARQRNAADAAVKSAYRKTGIEPKDVREAQTASETARNTMSGGGP